MRNPNPDSFDMVHDVGHLYRSLLSSFARPVESVSVDDVVARLAVPSYCSPVFAGIALVLLDQEVTFAVVGRDDRTGEYIRRLTGARVVPVSEADYVFVSTCEAESARLVVSALKRGTLLEPHLGATLFLLSDGLGSRPASRDDVLFLDVEGPGVNGLVRVQTPRVLQEWILERNRACEEYPLGIDMLWVSRENTILALPRTSRVKLA